jgi:hypothetical protein
LFRLFGWVVGRVESLELDWDSGMPFAAVVVVAAAKLQDNIVGGMEPVPPLADTAWLGWDGYYNRAAEEDLEAVELHEILAVELYGILWAELYGILVAELYGILVAELYGILVAELNGILVALDRVPIDHRVAVEEFALDLAIEHYLLSFHVFGGS